MNTLCGIQGVSETERKSVREFPKNIYILGINMVRDLIVHGIKLWCTSITNFALACWKATVHLFVISYGAKFKKMD